MVAEGTAVTSNTVNDSLAHRVQQLIDGKNDPILNSLIARQGSLPGRAETPEKASDAVDLNTSFTVRPGNEDMMAARVAKSLWPAIREHARSFTGQTASVMINPGEAPVERQHAEPLSEAISLDLPRLWFDIKKGLKRIALDVDKSTLYTIKLGDVSYRMITFSCQKEPADWVQFRELHTLIKNKYDVHLLIATEPPQKNLLEQSANSQISPSQLSAKMETYYRFQRQNALPGHLRDTVSDWRDIQFLSVDSGETRRPEDLFNVSQKRDGVIDIKVAIPLSGNSRLYFEPFQDLYCIGLKALVDSDGNALAFDVRPVLTHNTAPIDSFSASHVGNRTAISPDSGYHRRIESIRENPLLNTQITQLYELAYRLLRKQMTSGAAVTVDMMTSAPRTFDSSQQLQSELMVSTIMNFTQHLVARWVLQSDGAPPLVALRPHFRDNETIAQIERHVPWFNKSDLLFPRKRNAAAHALMDQGRPDLASSLADTIRHAHRHRRLVTVGSSDAIRVEDNFRFKAMKSVVGNMNNLQIGHVLTGSPALEPAIIKSLVNELNGRHHSRHVSRQQELLEETIKKGNSSAMRQLQGK